MARIRVNTEELRSSAKVFTSVTENVSKAGDEILSTAMSLPSYDGQLSVPARKAGYEIQKGLREIGAIFSSDAESLLNSAKAFEDVDNKVVNTIGENTLLLSGSPLLSEPLRGSRDSGVPTVTIETKTEWDGSITVIKIEEEQLPDGTVISTYTQTNTKVFSETEVKIWKTWDIIRDAIIDAVAAFLFSGGAVAKFALEFFGIAALANIANIWGNLDSHDLPQIEPGDKRVETHVGKIVIQPDGSSTAVWESKIEIFDASGNSKGAITGTYEK